jgi:hypothetical protein
LRPHGLTAARMAAAAAIPASVDERPVTAAGGHRALAAADRLPAVVGTPRPVATVAGDRHTVVAADRMAAEATAAIAKRNSGALPRIQSALARR